jgi:16S rRNA (cytosine967-C5)-methyltransferase
MIPPPGTAGAIPRLAGAAAVPRLALVPWAALAPLVPVLDAPLAEVLAGAAAERVLDRFLRAHRGLPREGRAAAAEAIFGVGLWRRRLAWQLGDDDGDPSRHPPRALLGALLRDLAGLLQTDAESIAGARLPSPRTGAPAALAIRFSLPDWLADELVRALGSEADSEADDADLLAAALSTPGPIFLRANEARLPRAALAERLAAEGIPTRPCRFASAGLEVTSPRANLLGSASFREGLCEVQDEGSQLAGALAATPLPAPAAAAASVGPHEVLDLCAGRGGKSLQLAALGAHVHACDADDSRLARLRDRAARAEAHVTVHGAFPPDDLRVDAALVDAPCSELGPLRRGPDQRFRLDPANFAALPPLQLELLSRAARHVRPGGRLVYVTCTFRRAEDQAVAEAFEALHPEYERARAPAPAALVGDDGFFRAWPHRHGTDGFFGAVWRRTPGA